MTDQVLALITARGGSKGLPRKNVLPLGDKPMIAWSIEAAKQSKVITDIVVSTDDEEIVEISEEYGANVPFRRPAELATDEASSKDVVLHALEVIEKKYDYIVLLQPTSPLRTGLHIDEAFALMQKMGTHTCVSMKEAEKPAHLLYTQDEKGDLQALIENLPEQRRQDSDALYAVNGAIYIFKPAHFESYDGFLVSSMTGYLMGNDVSVDIDDAQDLAYAEWLISLKQ